MVKLIALRGLYFFTTILPFGGKTLDQIFSSFEHYSRFFKFVVSFEKAKYSIRSSFPKVVLQSFHFGKRFVR